MIATGNNVHPGGKDFRGGSGRNTRAAGRIFAVGDDEIEPVLFAKPGQELRDGKPAGLSHDIADEEQFHIPNLIVKQTKHTEENKSPRTGPT